MDTGVSRRVVANNMTVKLPLRPSTSGKKWGGHTGELGSNP